MVEFRAHKGAEALLLDYHFAWCDRQPIYQRRSWWLIDWQCGWLLAQNDSNLKGSGLCQAQTANKKSSATHTLGPTNANSTAVLEQRLPSALHVQAWKKHEHYPSVTQGEGIFKYMCTPPLRGTTAVALCRCFARPLRNTFFSQASLLSPVPAPHREGGVPEPPK